MARPSDKEFQLLRKIKDLEALNSQKDIEIAKLKKHIEKLNKKDDTLSLTEKKKPVNVNGKPCPDCGAAIKITDLPHATMELCSKACGWRLVKQKGK